MIAPSILRAAANLVLAALSLVALAACSDAVQLVGTGGTGAPQKATLVAKGPITGFGSLIVNGQRFDESGARVTINGEPDRPVTHLALGMVVEVLAVEADSGSIPMAQSIVASALTVGTIESVDGGGSLRVAGQDVRASPFTSLQGVSDATLLRPGNRVTVYGLRNPAAGIDATRIEVAPDASPQTATRIVGMVSRLGATRFFLADQAVEFGSATLVNLPAGLGEGQFVEVQGPAFATGAALVATRIEGHSRFTLIEDAFVEIEDFISDFVGTGSFRILGQPVDAASATVSGGAPAMLANGVRVEVEGTVRQGKIVAARIEIRSAPSQPPPDPSITVEGVVTDFVTAASFRVRDQVIDASAARFSGGLAADLANGRNVSAIGMVRGAVLVASSLAFLPTSEPEGTPLAVSGAITDFSSPASFRVNGQQVATTAGTTFATGSAAGLANGRLVDVEGRLMGGVLVATQVTIRPDAPPAPQPQPTRLSGFITDYASPASFKVNNQSIAANSQTQYDDGSAANLANGRRVTVDGTLLGGIVTATRISFESDDDHEEAAEVEGTISAYSSLSEFIVKGQVIDASAARFLNGSPSKLAVGRRVHVKGPVTGGVLRATTISMEL